MFLELPETSPKYLVSGYIVVADRAGAQKPMLFKEGISAADYAAVLARDGFTISDSSMAIDAAALFAALSSIVNADGWLLIVEPKAAPSGGQWPQGGLLPQEVQQKIPAVSARKDDGKEGRYSVEFATWSAIGGQVKRWKMLIGEGRLEVVEEKVVAKVFPLGYDGVVYADGV